ncbi:terminase [Mobiluncus mulieris]|uniref:Terminase n=1 Tax=Mobiluncus mulieris TaxID=2052 RepID=A0A7Y0U2Y1_9ACTO|nr:terminase [Mobiluncus mulieris]NMW65991.1 terminase [Mobiluncus mulieris]
MQERKGKEEPRLWLKPLRNLTPETSRGFEVIVFAREILGVELWPWQQWLLIHGLELLEDNRTYRFKKIIVLVGRQNGKTTLASVLAAWWLYVESGREPDRVPPYKFKIVGTAQNLSVAEEPWNFVRRWGNPEPDADEAPLAIPALQADTRPTVRTNGKQSIYTRNLAHYEIKAMKSSRGKPVARAILDELREQYAFTTWDAVSQTTKSFHNNQLWGISNAGSERSVVLKKQYDLGVSLIDSWNQQVEQGGVTPQEWLREAKDPAFALFDWSAPPDCPWDDEEGILQSNPSIGYSGFTVDSIRAEYYGMREPSYRTEILCQWVPAVVDTYIKPEEWKTLEVPPLQIDVRKGTRTVWAVDTAVDRSMTYIAAATTTANGLPFVTVWEARVGTLWVVPYLMELAEQSGFSEVVIQARGCPAMEFIKPLQDAGLDVHTVEGSWFGVATGRLRDRVRERGLVVVEQPAVSLAVSGGITKRFGETDAWNRAGSAVDVSPIVAITLALYGLETMEATPKPQSAYSSGGLMILD